MKSDLDKLKNLNPGVVQHLQAVGIETEADLRQLGAVVAYRRLKHAFPENVSLLMLYALAGALHDCHWNDLPPDIQESLKAEGKPRSDP